MANNGARLYGKNDTEGGSGVTSIVDLDGAPGEAAPALGAESTGQSANGPLSNPTEAVVPSAERVLEVLRSRLESEGAAFTDGAARLCVPLDWISGSWKPGDPGAMDEIIDGARDRLRMNPGWQERLEAFLGGEIDLPDGRAGIAPRGGLPASALPQAGCAAMALRYATLGWPILPLHGAVDGACTCPAGRSCQSIGKHPRTKNGLKDASADPAVVTKWFRSWPNANVGILTGAKSGFVVLDIDPRHGGENSLAELCQRRGNLPDTLSANSGGGGRHLFFRHPGGKVGNPTNLDGLPGLDVRGDGGYIVAAPSSHASKGSYTWAGEFSREAVSEAPDWFYALANAGRASGALELSGPAQPSGAIPEGRRNRTLFEIGCRLRGKGNGQAKILAELERVNAVQCQPPLDKAEVERIANSAGSYDTGPANGDQLLVPIPDNAPTPDTDHPQLGVAVSTHSYRDSSGRALWHVCAFWNHGKLETRPLTLWGDEEETLRWRWKGPGKTRPLFRLPELLANPDAAVLVVRDEPSADQAATDFSSWAATCPAFGTVGIRTANWGTLRGRRVLVWAEDTEEGTAFAKEAAEKIRGVGAAKVVLFSHEYLPSEDGGLIRGRGDGGAVPTAAAGWTAAHLDGLLVETVAPASTFIDEMNCIRDNKDQLPPHRRDQAIADFLTASLRKRGKFYHEGDAAYLFLPAERRLIPINGESQAFVRLLAEYGLNKTENIFGYTTQRLWVEATTRGAQTEVRHFSHYNRRRNAVYVSNQGGLIYKVTPAGIEAVENGADGVIFLQDAEAEPFHVVDDFDPGQLDENGYSPVLAMLAESLSLDAGHLSPSHALMLVRFWLLARFVPELMPTKPILALVGEKGSAKTAAAKRIGLMLFGRGFDVTSVTEDVKDLDAAAAAAPLLVLDNADTDRKWLADKLAVLATGGKVKKRVLYTTNQMVTINSICWVILTSRTPHFKRDDVAERLLLLRTKRLPNFEAQGDLDDRTVEKRNLLMTSLLHDLVGVTEALQAYGADKIAGDVRMADFYAFAIRVARHCRKENETQEAFVQLQRAQVGFAAEGDPIAGLINSWLLTSSANAGRWIKAADLYAELCAVGERHRRPMPEGLEARSFCHRLSASIEALEARFVINQRDRKNTKEYSFRFPASDLTDV